jgi:hypothetical protein
MKISPRECRTRGVPPVLMQHVDDLIAPESKVRLVQPLPRRVTVVPEMCYNMHSNERCKRRSVSCGCQFSAIDTAKHFLSSQCTRVHVSRTTHYIYLMYLYMISSPLYRYHTFSPIIQSLLGFGSSGEEGK